MKLTDMDNGGIIALDMEVNEAHLLLKEYHACLLEFIPKRKRTIELLEKICDALNKHNKKGNIAEITGAGACILGSVAILTAPFTGGASLAFAGAALGIGGGVTSIGSGITVNILEGKLMNEAKKILEDDENASKRVNELGKKISNISSEVLAALRTTVGVAKGVTTAVKSGEKIVRFVAKLAGKPIRKGGINGIKHIGKARNVAKVAGTVLEVITIPLNVWQIVDSAQSIAKGSEKAAVLKRIIEELKEDLAEKEELVS